MLNVRQDKYNINNLDNRNKLNGNLHTKIDNINNIE